MALLLFIIETPKEEGLLKIFFEQHGFKVLLSNPSYSNYIKTLQYKPDLVLAEMPPSHVEQVNFIKLIRKHRKARGLKIVGYGGFTDSGIINGFKKIGVDRYFPRPIKAGLLLQVVKELVPKNMAPDSPEKPLQDRCRDIELLLGAQAKPMQKIETMVSHVRNLLAFPFTVARVLQITQNVDTGAGDLAKAVRTDPVIASTILKVSNSVFFSGRDKRISGIKEAIVRIGFRETKNIAMSLSVMKLFPGEKRNRGFDRVEFWYHSLACGVIAEKLACAAGYSRPEEAFITGLLHDFGIIILDEFFGEIFAQVMDIATRQGTSFIEEERKLLAIDHGEVAERLFSGWQMPDQVGFAVKNHEKFLDEFKDVDSEYVMLNRCVGVANIMAIALQLGRGADCCVHPVPDELFRQLKCPAGITKDFLEKVYAQMTMFNRFLNLSARAFPATEPAIENAGKIKIACVRGQPPCFDPFQAYIASQGYALSEIRAGEKTAQGDSPPDLVVAVAGESMKPQDFESCMKIVRKSDGGGRVTCVPVLLIHDEKFTVPTLKSKENLKTLPDRIDLRKIDREIALSLGLIEPVITAAIEPLKKDELFVSQKSLNEKIRIISVTGSIRAGTINVLRTAFSEAIAMNVNTLALDLRNTDFIDSSGLGLLVNLHKRMNSLKSRLCLMSPGSQIQKILEAVNLSSVFTIIQDEKQLEKSSAS